jgi:hypothetical protein
MLVDRFRNVGIGISPPTKPKADVTNVIQLLFTRPAAKKRISHTEETLGLDAVFELDSFDDDETTESSSCLKIRTLADSLEQPYRTSSNVRICDLTTTSTKSVSFGHVEIHSHAIVLGDNPSVSCGPPLTMKWKAFDNQTLTLDDYEQHRPDRRLRDAMVIPRMVREDWLRNAGFARSQLRDSIASLAKIKQQRLRSARDGPRRTATLRRIVIC